MNSQQPAELTVKQLKPACVLCDETTLFKFVMHSKMRLQGNPTNPTNRLFVMESTGWSMFKSKIKAGSTDKLIFIYQCSRMTCQ